MQFYMTWVSIAKSSWIFGFSISWDINTFDTKFKDCSFYYTYKVIVTEMDVAEKHIDKKRIAIFASGSGSNAQKIMEHFKKHESAEVAILLCNNPDAFVLQRADNFEVPTHVFSKEEFRKTDTIVDLLKNLQIDLIVLAGFLWLIPDKLLKAFPHKIINIHPALLPLYGGKGMYGDRVHQAVLDSQEEESGITIHFINEHFDEGEIIYQAKYKIEPDDTVEIVRFKGQQLEHLHYPRIIEQVLK